MVDYNEIRNQLRQRQSELAKQRVNISKIMLRNGLQGRPQRKQISIFNKQLGEQSSEYEKQISDIDKFLLGEKTKRLSIMGEGETYPANPEPTITLFDYPNIKNIRNRFRRGGLWFQCNLKGITLNS